MKLKIKRAMYTNGRVYRAGSVEEIDDKKALALISGGFASPLEIVTEEIETAVIEKPEKKVAPKKTSKKKTSKSKKSVNNEQ